MAVRFLLVLILIAASVSADDSLRTVREFGHRIFHNLNFADTLNGSDRLDSVDAQRIVRDAVRNVRYPKSKSVTLADGSFAYLLDDYLYEVVSALTIYGGTVDVAKVVEFERFKENMTMTGSMWDSLLVDMVSWFGDSVYVYPIPVKAGSLIVYYTVRGPNCPVGGDTTDYVVDIPVEYYDQIDYWGAAEAALTLMMPAEFQYFWNLYLREVGEEKVE